MILDYSAACGLLGGLRKRSLKEDDLGQLKEKDTGSLRESLKNYLGEDYPSEDGIDFLERGLYISHIKKTVKLLRFLGPSPRDILKTLLLEFDISNLKLLMRHIKLERDVDAKMFYWGYRYLIFKDKDPASFKGIEDLERYLKRGPLIKDIFTKALKDLDFYKDIYYFDIRLDKEYFQLLEKVSLDLDKKSSLLLQYFIVIKSLTYALRLKFFQRKDPGQIRNAICVLPFFDEELFSKVLDVTSLGDALSIIEASRIFSRFKRELSSDFEQDFEDIFYHQFLKKRGIDFFNLHPYLIFYLSQRYLIEKTVFIINSSIR